MSTLLLLGISACRGAKQPDNSAVADTIPDTAVAQTTIIANTNVAANNGPVDARAGAADAIRRYYAAIQSRQYDVAYALWDAAGKVSGQSRSEFANGFRETDRAIVTIGDSVSIEGAAGSQYATVPVTVEAVLRSGGHQRFAGTYTLRRAMVDGATPEQRSWRIYAAHLHRAAERTKQP